MALLDFNSPQSLGLLGLSLLNQGNSNNNQDNSNNVDGVGGLLMNAAKLMSFLKNNQTGSTANTNTNTPPMNTNSALNNTQTNGVPSPLAANPTIDQIMQSIGKVESSGNYGAMGPRTKSGDRAYGKYQVMGSNIPSWSRQALGQSLSPQQFLNNPQAQDAVAQYMMSKYYNQYQNPQDVASMWFSGRPLANNNSRDITGTSVPQYVSRTMSNLNSVNVDRPAPLNLDGYSYPNRMPVKKPKNLSPDNMPYGQGNAITGNPIYL